MLNIIQVTSLNSNKSTLPSDALELLGNRQVGLSTSNEVGRMVASHGYATDISRRPPFCDSYHSLAGFRGMHGVFQFRSSAGLAAIFRITVAVDGRHGLHSGAGFCFVVSRQVTRAMSSPVVARHRHHCGDFHAECVYPAGSCL